MCAGTLETQTRYRVSTHVGEMDESQPKLGTLLQKTHRINLCQIRQKLERKSPEEHMYTLLPGKTQQKPENKSMPLTSQTQQKYDNRPLSINTRKERKY